jgi:hypothetical protein
MICRSEIGQLSGLSAIRFTFESHLFRDFNKFSLSRVLPQTLFKIIKRFDLGLVRLD